MAESVRRGGVPHHLDGRYVERCLTNHAAVMGSWDMAQRSLQLTFWLSAALACGCGRVGYAELDAGQDGRDDAGGIVDAGGSRRLVTCPIELWRRRLLGQLGALAPKCRDGAGSRPRCVCDRAVSTAPGGVSQRRWSAGRQPGPARVDGPPIRRSTALRRAATRRDATRSVQQGCETGPAGSSLR